MDARGLGTMVSRKLRELTSEDVGKIAGFFTAFEAGTLADEKGFCAVVAIEEIAKQDFVLTPGRYVGVADAEEDGEPFEEKMTRLTGELSELFVQSRKAEEEIKKQLSSIGFEVVDKYVI